MKKYIPVTFIILIIIAAMYSFVYFFALPKTAQALIPYKWEKRFLENKREDIKSYLGNVSTEKSDTDIWVKRVNNYTYSLTILYNAQDSTAEKYFIEYSFKSNLFQRSQTIYADSVQ
jgi:uncharacterized membrane protein YukC